MKIKTSSTGVHQTNPSTSLKLKTKPERKLAIRLRTNLLRILPGRVKRIVWPVSLFFLSRAVIFSLVTVFVGLWPEKDHPSFLEAFSQWDGQWFLKVVREGYSYQGPTVQATPVFFPLYPLLAKVLTWFGTTADLGLFIVANLAGLGFFVVFWLWAKREFSVGVARRSLLYQAIFPLSFFLSCFYSESLYLFLTVLFFYWLGQKKWWPAALTAGLASATRPFGAILILPLLYAYFRNSIGLKIIAGKQVKKTVGLQNEVGQLVKAFQGYYVRKKHDIAGGLLFLIRSSGLVGTALAGLIAYCLYLYYVIGELFPFAKLNSQAWHHFWTTPWQATWLFLQSIFLGHPEQSIFAVAVIDLLAVVFFGWLMVVSLKRLALVYQLYLWPVFLLSWCHPWNPDHFLASASITRHFWQLFPLMAVLAFESKKRRWLHYFLIIFWSGLYGLLPLAFAHGWWIQ